MDSHGLQPLDDERGKHRLGNLHGSLLADLSFTDSTRSGVGRVWMTFRTFNGKQGRARMRCRRRVWS